MAIERLHPEKFVDARFANLRKLYPEAFSEGRINWDKLKVLLADQLDEEYPEDEPFGLSWPGKRQAMRLATLPTKAALIPVPGQGIDEERTRNVFIEGENLEVLKVLKKAYQGKIKMIYIDPPYNTGNDFVYEDDFKEPLKDYLRRTGQADADAGDEAFTTNTKAQGRFHSKWLSMMYPRLKLAKELLSDDGVIFISIDDSELCNLRLLCDGVFDEEGFICSLIWNKQHSQQQGLFKRYHEYVLLYAKDPSKHSNIVGGDGVIEAGALKKISRANPASDFEFPAGVRFDAPDGTEFWGTFGDSEKVTVVSGRFVAMNGVTSEPVVLSAGWTQKDQMRAYFSGEEVFDTKGQKVLEFYFSSTGKLKCRKDRSKITPPTMLPLYGMVSEQTAHLASLFGRPVFDNPKPVQMIRDFCSWFLSDSDIVLDFFAGSGTTGEALLQLNAGDDCRCRFILVQFPEICKKNTDASKAGFNNIAEICKERIRRVINKFSDDLGRTPGDLDLGFKVFKLDESSFKPWETYRGESAAEIEDLFASAVTPLRSDWRSNVNGLLTEVLLLLGFPLDSKVEASGEYRNNSVLTVSSDFHPDRHLFVCLDEHLDQDTVESLDLGEHDLFVCLDSAIDDQSKARLADKGKIYTI